MSKPVQFKADFQRVIHRFRPITADDELHGAAVGGRHMGALHHRSRRKLPTVVDDTHGEKCLSRPAPRNELPSGPRDVRPVPGQPTPPTPQRATGPACTASRLCAPVAPRRRRTHAQPPQPANHGPEEPKSSSKPHHGRPPRPAADEVSHDAAQTDTTAYRTRLTGMMAAAAMIAQIPATAYSRL